MAKQSKTQRFFTMRAEKIAASRADNVALGITERMRRQMVKELRMLNGETVKVAKYDLAPVAKIAKIAKIAKTAKTAKTAKIAKIAA